MEKKILLYPAFIVGAAAIVYGMARENDVAFIIGAAFVAGAYLMFRKRLKASSGKKQ